MKRIQICVVGAGIIGLSSAVRISETHPELQVTLIAEKISPETTGDGSGGLVFPHLTGNTAPDLVKRWVKETTGYLQQLMTRPNSGSLGVYTTSGYMLYKERLSELPSWKDTVPCVREMTKEELDVFKDFKYGLFCTTYMAECRKYLPWLMNKFFDLGGKFIRRRILNFKELSSDYDIVVNCTGLAPRDILGDKEMVCYKGQVIRVQAPWVRHFISTDEDIYIIPNTDFVVLGGTQDENNFTKTIDPVQRQRIWEGSCKLMPSLETANIVGEWVGFRPGRSVIRLEIERMNIGDGKQMQVIHNYGHGGSGVSLHWGCAGDVVKLLEQLLPTNVNQSAVRAKL